MPLITGKSTPNTDTQSSTNTILGQNTLTDYLLLLQEFSFLFLILSAAKFWKERKEITILAFLAFFLMFVEAWMGKMVIDTNLKPTIITIHMVGGLLIIALLLRLRFITSD